MLFVSFLHLVSKCTNSNVSTQREEQVPGNVVVYVSSIVGEQLLLPLNAAILQCSQEC